MLLKMKKTNNQRSGCLKRDINFNYIRVAAMVAIVLCHYFQVYGFFGVSSWLNIGVQVFFVLSAKLISTKKFNTKGDVLRFLKTRILRIYIPVWIYLICLIPVLFVVGRGPDVSAIIMYFLGLAGFSEMVVLGLGHFWYISVLLICYLLVPVLYKIADFCKNTGKAKAFVLQVAVTAVPVLVFLFTQYKFYGVNIAFFCAAYFLFYKTKDNENWYKGKAIKLFPLVVVLTAIRLFTDTKEIASNSYYDGLFVTSVKAITGMFLFFAMYKLLLVLKAKELKIVDYISDISYEVYIVHQFILLALFEFISFFKSGVAGKVSMLICSVIMIFFNAVIVFYVKKFIEKRVIKK